MKLINSLIKVNLRSGNTLLINALNGLIDEISSMDLNNIDVWETEDSIEPKTDEEKILYEKLLLRGYIVENTNDENRKREDLVNKLNNSHKKTKEAFDIVSFILTYDCNFACTYCYEAENKISLKNKYLTKDMVDRVFTIARGRIKHINFFGGEPLLLPNMGIIKYIIENFTDVSYSVITNGYYLEEYFDIFKVLKHVSFQVTIDGPKEIHDKRRIPINGAPTYDKIMRGIELYLNAGILIKIRMNVDKNDYSVYTKFRMELLGKWHAFRDNLSFELYPLFKHKNELLDEIYKNDLSNELVNNGELRPTMMNEMLGLSLPIVNYIATGKRFSPMYSSCDADLSCKFFDPEGYIYSCILAVGQKDKAIGTYYQEYQLFENSIFDRNISNIEKCSSCKYAFLCGGGCTLEVINGGCNRVMPNCSFTLHALHSTLPIVYEARKEVMKRGVSL